MGWLVAFGVLVAVWESGFRLVPSGKQLNAAGVVLLSLFGLLAGGAVATSMADSSTALLGSLAGMAVLSGVLIKRFAGAAPLVIRSAGAMLLVGGALGAETLQHIATMNLDYSLASMADTASAVAMGVAVLYLLAAAVVAVGMPRRAAPISVVLGLMGLVALAVSRSGWSVQGLMVL